MNYVANARKLRPIVEQAMQSIDGNDALTAKMLYPEWAVGVAYSVGFKVQYGGKLYRVITSHTTQADWTPDVSASLFEVVNESHEGTLEDPIPYDGNMALENGKYYIQSGVIYLCTRDTINPVYQPLVDLVGLFVEVV